MGVATSAYTFVWWGKTGPLRESGINYIHSVLYVQPEFTARLGTVIPERIVRYGGEESRGKFTLKIYENVKAGDKDLCVFSEIVFENNEWKVMWMTVTENDISKELVHNQKWV